MGMYSDFALDSLEQDEFKRKKKRKNPFDIDSELNIDDLNISERQRNALKKLDMANQLTIIRALREGQELKNSNYGTQYAKNDRSSVVDGGLGSLSAKYESNNNLLKAVEGIFFNNSSLTIIFILFFMSSLSKSLLKSVGFKYSKTLILSILII